MKKPRKSKEKIPFPLFRAFVMKFKERFKAQGTGRTEKLDYEDTKRKKTRKRQPDPTSCFRGKK